MRPIWTRTADVAALTESSESTSICTIEMGKRSRSMAARAPASFKVSHRGNDGVARPPQDDAVSKPMPALVPVMSTFDMTITSLA